MICAADGFWIHRSPENRESGVFRHGLVVRIGTFNTQVKQILYLNRRRRVARFPPTAVDISNGRTFQCTFTYPAFTCTTGYALSPCSVTPF